MTSLGLTAKALSVWWRMPAKPAFAWHSSVQSVWDAGEDYSWFEEEQALDVQGSLVVEQPLWAAEDQLRHDHDCYCFWIGSDLAEIANQRVADVPVGRFLYLQR